VGARPQGAGRRAAHRLRRSHLQEESRQAEEQTGVQAWQRISARPKAVRLRQAASETTVKRSALSDYRVVYFATHGLVAGVKGLAEPSLALTLPKQPSDTDERRLWSLGEGTGQFFQATSYPLAVRSAPIGAQEPN
jgi:hypothetical protein